MYVKFNLNYYALMSSKLLKKKKKKKKKKKSYFPISIPAGTQHPRTLYINERCVPAGYKCIVYYNGLLLFLCNKITFMIRCSNRSFAKIGPTSANIACECTTTPTLAQSCTCDRNQTPITQSICNVGPMIFAIWAGG